MSAKDWFKPLLEQFSIGSNNDSKTEDINTGILDTLNTSIEGTAVSNPDKSINDSSKLKESDIITVSEQKITQDIVANNIINSESLSIEKNITIQDPNHAANIADKKVDISLPSLSESIVVEPPPVNNTIADETAGVNTQYNHISENSATLNVQNSNSVSSSDNKPLDTPPNNTSPVSVPSDTTIFSKDLLDGKIIDSDSHSQLTISDITADTKSFTFNGVKYDQSNGVVHWQDDTGKFIDMTLDDFKAHINMELEKLPETHKSSDGLNNSSKSLVP
jgi:hypothetical protein